MKTYSNKAIDPTDKKKPKSNVTYNLERGKEKKEYKAERTLSGHPEYGKENASNKDAKFIEDARAKKEDIAYKDGKPYRAGTTTVTKTPDKFSMDVKVDKPNFKPVSKPAVPEKKKEEGGNTGKKMGKLKPMAMTYGTDSPTKGGGTMYKKKVRSLMGR